MKTFFPKLYFPSLLAFILIFYLGALTLYSVSPQRLTTQIEAFLIGIVGLGIFAYTDYRVFKSFAKPIYILGLVLLSMTFVFGNIVFGSARWLELGGFSFQTSEIAKLTLLLSIAALISTSSKYVKAPKYIAMILGLTIAYLILILLQPDLGTSIIVFTSIAGILFFAGLSKWYFIGSIAFFGIFSNPLWNMLHDYQQKRILIFINPFLDTKGAGYNVIQSKIAVGSGQLLGEGIGRGTQSHLQYLPAYWTDFIFASFAEEWGFVGVLILLVTFFVFLISILYLAFKTEDTFGYLLATGIFVIFLTQFFINAGMNLGVMPVTGIPLPFFSYGGTSLVISMCMIGILQSIWVHRKIT